MAFLDCTAKKFINNFVSMRPVLDGDVKAGSRSIITVFETGLQTVASKQDE